MFRILGCLATPCIVHFILIQRTITTLRPCKLISANILCKKRKKIRRIRFYDTLRVLRYISYMLNRVQLK